MNELSKEVEDTLEQGLADAFSPKKSNGHGPSDEDRALAMKAATFADPDVAKPARSMRDQMAKIIAGLESDIEEATAVRRTITRRINYMMRALNASRAADDAVSQPEDENDNLQT